MAICSEILKLRLYGNIFFFLTIVILYNAYCLLYIATVDSVAELHFYFVRKGWGKRYYAISVKTNAVDDGRVKVFHTKKLLIMSVFKISSSNNYDYFFLSYIYIHTSPVSQRVQTCPLLISFFLDSCMVY